MVDENNKVAINSKETVAALEYAKELYPTFVPGTLSWLDPNNNKAFLAGEISLTINGISIYYAAKNSTDPKMQGDGRRTSSTPTCRSARSARRPRSALLFTAMIFKYTQVSERGQGVPALHDGEGAVRAVAEGLDRLRHAAADGLRIESGLDRGSQAHAVQSSMQEACCRTATPGKLGDGVGGVMADFIVVNMVAEAATGAASVARRDARPSIAPSATTADAGTLRPAMNAPQTQVIPSTRPAGGRAVVPRAGCSTTAISWVCCSCCRPALLLLLFLTYPLGPRRFARLHRRQGRPARRMDRHRELRIPGHRQRVPAVGVQHVPLHHRSRASAKFALGLWLALLLNEHIPFKAFIRAIVLLPFIVPTVLSAIAFWWIYDAQFSIVSWVLQQAGRDRHLHRFPRRARCWRACR